MQLKSMRAVAFAATMVFAAATGMSAAAAVVVDQSNLGAQDVGLNGVDYGWQQQVTAGLSGRLAGVTLFGIGGARVRIGLGDAVTAGPFAFSDLVTLAVGGTFIDTTAANLILAAGDRFVIDLTDSTNGYGATTNPYAGGHLFLVPPGGPTFDYTTAYGIALRFVTFVDTGVPEPATWTVMLIGFGAVGGALRRRRRPISA
ncbi:MAG: sorting protein [Caulobacteraceae bacterium]|nr:sorting protein [Caulobacteraceae bacterium]